MNEKTQTDWEAVIVALNAMRANPENCEICGEPFSGGRHYAAWRAHKDCVEEMRAEEAYNDAQAEAGYELYISGQER